MSRYLLIRYHHFHVKVLAASSLLSLHSSASSQSSSPAVVTGSSSEEEDKDKEESLSGQENSQGSKRKRASVETETDRDSDKDSRHQFSFPVLVCLPFLLPFFLFHSGVAFKSNHISKALWFKSFFGVFSVALRGQRTTAEENTCKQTKHKTIKKTSTSI